MAVKCPDSPTGEHVFSPDEEYAQRKGGQAPICCEHCGAEPPKRRIKAKCCKTGRSRLAYNPNNLRYLQLIEGHGDLPGFAFCPFCGTDCILWLTEDQRKNLPT